MDPTPKGIAPGETRGIINLFYFTTGLSRIASYCVSLKLFTLSGLGRTNHLYHRFY